MIDTVSCQVSEIYKQVSWFQVFNVHELNATLTGKKKYFNDWSRLNCYHKNVRSEHFEFVFQTACRELTFNYGGYLSAVIQINDIHHPPTRHWEGKIHLCKKWTKIIL